MRETPRLLFYSGGQEPSNNRLHAGLVDMVGSKASRSITYMPFCTAGAMPFYDRFVRRYRRFGFRKFHFLPADQKLTQTQIKTALRSDAVYLAGGNTFYFLKMLRARGLIPALRRYARRGGVLAGLSAGAIIMSPNIGLAAYPEFDADVNDVGLKNFNSLNLVNFEFYPHYVNSKRVNDAMLVYSRQVHRPVFACRDGSGIMIRGDVTSFFGKITMFFEGNMAVIAP